MKTRIIVIHAFLICAGLFILAARPSHSDGGNQVHLIQLNDDTINPVTAEYITQSIDRAHQDSARCLIIKLDTPGGLLSSTRIIVKKMLTAKVPIVVYIAPDGSRAGSAGVFITYASHVAAMAPSTNIGAAHPVQIGDQAPKQPNEWGELRRLIEELRDTQAEKDKVTPEGTPQETQTPAMEDTAKDLTADENPMESKILNDTVAFIKAIAKERNRNAEWGVDSVVKSDSITSEEAVQKGVVEIIAKDEADLLAQLDGRSVTIDGQAVTLQTKGAEIVTIAMNSRQKFFNVLANPNIAYILMIIGFYGLLFEVTHPGGGVPGILGVIFLILAFYSMQTLPTNYAGLALMILGLVLLVAETFTPAFGVLTLGGLACLILGSMLLFESADPVMRVSRSTILAFSLTTAGITLFLMRSVLRAHRTKVHGGEQGLVGEEGIVKSAIKSGAEGKVFVHGELWNAVSDNPLQNGDKIVVESVKGLILKVRKS